MRTLFALAFVVCLSSVVEAQTVVAQLASLSPQFREGTSTTNSVDVPLNITETVDEIQIVLDIQTAAYEDPTTELKIRLYRLIPASGTWQMIGSVTKLGGRYVDPETLEVNPPITMSMSASMFAGFTVRAEVETANRIRLGVIVNSVRN